MVATRHGSAERSDCQRTVAVGYRLGVPLKYVTVESVATLVHHTGPTTLPGSPPDTTKGRTVLCLHDAGGNGSQFTGVLEALAEKHSPVAYDQPGHGRSATLDSLGDIAKMASHVRLLSDALGLRAPVLLGVGMGAAVAIEAAVADPSWASALILCGGTGLRCDVDDEAVTKMRRIAGGKARREFDQTGYAPGTPREVFGKAFAEWVKTDPRATVGDLVAMQAWTATGRLAAVTCPTLVVVGEHETDAARAAATALADALPDGRTITLAGAARNGVVEQPAALAAVVDQLRVTTGAQA